MNNDITHGTTNVFADLNFSDAAERQTKTRLALAVNELLKTRKLKQREVAELLHIPQPKVSALKNYRLDQFSVKRLIAFLTALDQDVEIMIRSRGAASGAGHISVLAVRRNSKRQLSRARAGGCSITNRVLTPTPYLDALDNCIEQQPLISSGAGLGRPFFLE